MMPHTQTAPLTEQLLLSLRHEEHLLLQARCALAEIHRALRASDLPAVFRAQHQHQSLQQELTEIAHTREEAAFALATFLDLPAKGISISLLSTKLSPANSAPLVSLRDRLQTLTGEILELQRRNANLLNSLRSYFRSVLSGLTDEGDSNGTGRYGPSGVRLGNAVGSGLLAHG